ncbi:hypothetical protein INR49_008753, partial [Caranx melampygus]
MKSNLKGFVDSGVLFEDGTVEENINAVIFCTGSSCLPSKKEMLEIPESERRENMKSYPSPEQAALQVDYIPYLDFMAKQ